MLTNPTIQVLMNSRVEGEEDPGALPLDAVLANHSQPTGPLDC